MTADPDSSADVVVIGGGMAGASCAYFLADDAEVVLLERETQPGYHTTGRSAALFFENYGNEVIRRITRASRAFLTEPPDGFTDVPLLTPRGALAVAGPDLLDRLDEEIAASPGMEVLEGAPLYELAPFLRPDRIVRGAYEADAMDMDVHAILQGFLRGLRRKGGRIATDAEVLSLTRDGTAWRIETRAGTFHAPTVVNAAGAWCDALAEMAGVSTVGLVPKRRTAFTFDPPAGSVIEHWPLAVLCDETWYVKPDAGRVLGSPADEIASPPTDAQPELEDVALAIDRIQRDTTFEIHRPASTWAGLRSFVADKSPVVGMAPDGDGFFWLAGQGGYGIQTSAGMGRLSASLIKGDGLPDDLVAMGLTEADLAPDRASLGLG